MTRVLNKKYLDDQIKQNEECRKSGTYGGKEKCVQNFGGEMRRKESTCEV